MSASSCVLNVIVARSVHGVRSWAPSWPCAGRSWLCAGLCWEIWLGSWPCAGRSWLCAGRSWPCAGKSWPCAGRSGSEVTPEIMALISPARSAVAADFAFGNSFGLGRNRRGTIFGVAWWSADSEPDSDEPGCSTWSQAAPSILLYMLRGQSKA